MKQLPMPIVLLFLFLLGCEKDSRPVKEPSPAYTTTRTISYNGVSVDVVIDKPAGDSFDVLLVYHGTVNVDSAILQAANSTLQGFKSLLAAKDMMIISVAYPEENLLFGDNIVHCEAALLWTKHLAAAELGITVKKIFLGGHSQGGYLVTRLNTLHPTDGVVANAPGPLNLLFRCQLEENGQVPGSPQCSLLQQTFGPTTQSPQAYTDRSLLSFTQGFQGDILVVQGLNDSPIQMHSWPQFKSDIQNCANCQNVEILEIPNQGHNSLFNSPQARAVFNAFVEGRR
jgi:acetyl esterase/lipase